MRVPQPTERVPQSAESPKSFPALPVPRSETGRAALAALLADPARSLIGLDFDGTLAPIVPEPAQARALPAATAALRRLSGLVGTLAIITGRPAREAVAFASLEEVPGIVVLGHYGRQRWSGGTLTAPPPPAGLAEARDRLPAVLEAARAAQAQLPVRRLTPGPGLAPPSHPA